MLPPEGRDGVLLRHHKHAAHAPVELREIGKTAAGPTRVVHYTPEAFNGMEMVPAAGWQARQPQARLPLEPCRGERGRAVETPAIDDHHHRLPRGGKGGHHVRDIWSKPLSIKLGDDRRE